MVCSGYKSLKIRFFQCIAINFLLINIIRNEAFFFFVFTCKGILWLKLSILHLKASNYISFRIKLHCMSVSTKIRQLLPHDWQRIAFYAINFLLAIIAYLILSKLAQFSLGTALSSLLQLLLLADRINIF